MYFRRAVDLTISPRHLIMDVKVCLALYLPLHRRMDRNEMPLWDDTVDTGLLVPPKQLADGECRYDEIVEFFRLHFG